eukprot:CCRYP_009743-RA/>CCRYP_009743-RA protein AED:0.03 eAED:0.03 QI:462/1/1/1/1/1/2/609/329
MNDTINTSATQANAMADNHGNSLNLNAKSIFQDDANASIDSDAHGTEDGKEPKAKRVKKDAPVKTREMRLEQNRKAARESRRRKKVLVEELQRSVIFFSRANGTLRTQNEEMEQMLLQAQAQIQALEGAGKQQQTLGLPQAGNLPSVASTPWASMMGQQVPFQQAANVAPAPPPAASPFGMAGLAGVNMMKHPSSFNGMGFSQASQIMAQGQNNVLQEKQQVQSTQNQGNGQTGGGDQQQQQQPQLDNNLLANWMNLQAAMSGGAGGINPAMMSPFMNLNSAGMGGQPNFGMMPFAFPGFMNQGAGNSTGVNNPLANMGSSPTMNAQNI